jgi:hypothetical protein
MGQKRRKKQIIQTQSTSQRSKNMWKYTFYFLAIAASGFAAQTTPIDANPTAPLLQHTPPGTPALTYMMIPPASRALDFQQAFEQMRAEKSTGKVYFELSDGTMISNIIDMHVMQNSTLILFRFNSNQGIRYQVVKVEDIHALRY